MIDINDAAPYAPHALDEDAAKHAAINRLAETYVHAAFLSAERSTAADRHTYLEYVAAAFEQASETIRARMRH